MTKNRSQRIKEGKIWHIWTKDDKENVIFEGTKTQVYKYLRDNNLMRNWRRGKGNVSIGRVIMEF